MSEPLQTPAEEADAELVQAGHRAAVAKARAAYDPTALPSHLDGGEILLTSSGQTLLVVGHTCQDIAVVDGDGERYPLDDAVKVFGRLTRTRIVADDAIVLDLPDEQDLEDLDAKLRDYDLVHTDLVYTRDTGTGAGHHVVIDLDCPNIALPSGRARTAAALIALASDKAYRQSSSIDAERGPASEGGAQ